MPVMIDGFEFDIAESEELGLDSEVTAHPVEKGADTADHIRLLPITLTVRLVVSNTPIGAIADRRGDVDSNGVYSNPPAADARAWLEALRARREPVQVVTSDGTQLESMALEKLSFPKDRNTGDALDCVASFRQVELITNERTTIMVAVPRAAAKVNRGNKPSPAPDQPAPAKVTRNRSALHKLIRGGD